MKHWRRWSGDAPTEPDNDLARPNRRADGCRRTRPAVPFRPANPQAASPPFAMGTRDESVPLRFSRRDPAPLLLCIRLYIWSVRATLDHATILGAGCELARRDGVDALGVRSVAGVVGATPMALYRYVSDAADLRDAVLARLFESLPARPESVDDVPRWARTFRAWLTDVPGLSRLVLIRWFELPPLLDIVEALLRVFNQVGLEGFELVAAANSLFSYVVSRGELEEAVRASGVRRSLSWEEGETQRPLLNSLREEYEVARLDEHFDFGLELLLRGLLGHASGAVR